jgi:hypothetical protein
MSANERRGEERRRHPRVAVDLPVRLTIGNESLPGRIRDLCRDAALVEVHRECALGTEVVLAFDLGDEGSAIQVSGEIIRLAPGDGDARGVAVLFRDLQPQAEGRIEMFLSREQQ